MELKNKIIISLLLSGGVFLVCYLWLLFRPVEIIAVHQRNSYSDVLVSNFPFANKGKIDWWLKNKEMLRTKYDIPKPSSYGSSSVVFWLFNDGYKEEGKYDRLCFNDMATKVNCIDKNTVLTVGNSKRYGTRFTLSDGIYRIDENGRVIKINK
ncbi:DUF943 family protein [Enterobacter sp. Ap-916]|uniref:DUF943 family protein n=1 Tax=unclassified Enterobacter TaxID=2608935 RepID=UPI00141F5B94|nr:MULTISPECIES: DUF943 family protein [unclassified Enterobacter]NIF60161.1 DUF943 family protein [Enterobacter sp. Ap-867]NIG31568.1 DUF943 family protein [Enterobacter sp. Ap-916]